MASFLSRQYMQSGSNAPNIKRQQLRVSLIMYSLMSLAWLKMSVLAPALPMANNCTPSIINRRDFLPLLRVDPTELPEGLRQVQLRLA
jgi:hypothetical protein